MVKLKRCQDQVLHVVESLRRANVGDCLAAKRRVPLLRQVGWSIRLVDSPLGPKPADVLLSSWVYGTRGRVAPQQRAETWPVPDQCKDREDQDEGADTAFALTLIWVEGYISFLSRSLGSW